MNPLCAADVCNSIGVCTHMAYNTTAYANAANVLVLLKGLHIRHVRDGFSPAWQQGDPQFSIRQQLKADGISAIAVVPWSDPLPTPTQLIGFAEMSGNIEAFEASNEPDVNLGADWPQKVEALAEVLLQAGAKLGIPVIGPALVNATSYPILGKTVCQVGNAHVYFGGRQPETPPFGPDGRYSMAWWLQQAQGTVPAVKPPLPSWITETGYIAPPVPQPYQVSWSVQACYLLRTIFDALYCGFSRTYIYELLDQSPTGDGYGIVASNFAPKPAYTAIRHLLETLADSGTFTLEPRLQYTLFRDIECYGATGPTRSFEMQKRDGSRWIAIWQTSSMWNEATATLAPFSSPTVTFVVPAGWQVAQVTTIGESGADPAIIPAPSTRPLMIALGNGVTLVKVVKG